VAIQFKSVGGAMSRALRDHLIEQETRRRQNMMDSLLVNERMRQQALLDMEMQRQAERDRIGDERYAQERQDRLMAQADARATQYQNAELARQQREEDQRQRSMDRADAAANRYQDAELRRQDQEADRAFHARENEAQRANARGIAAMQMGGRSGADKTEGQRKTDGLLSRAQAARATGDKLESSMSTVDLLAPNFLRTSNGQQYRQAAKQWIQSVLRDESGAAIGAEEEASYFETYFRQPGDSKAVIRQKQEARDAAEEAMARKVGSGGSRNTSPRSRYSYTVED
jgi:hypothetical protein